MAGIEGLDEFIKGLGEHVDNIGKLDGLSVSVDPADTLRTVEDKVRVELRRRGAAGFSEAEIRGMAADLLHEARR